MVDWRCRESEGKAKIEGYMSISDEEAHQCFKRTLPSGKTIEKLHPIAFTSKCTSQAKERYKPFLLEFAVLKFSLDKFSNIIWGFPVEIEMDYQAIRDIMLNDKLNANHACWRDGILAHHIIDVRHISGKINVAADGISRKWEGKPRELGDGSEHWFGK